MQMQSPKSRPLSQSGKQKLEIWRWFWESPPYSLYTLCIREHTSSLPSDKWGPPDVINVRWLKLCGAWSTSKSPVKLFQEEVAGLQKSRLFLGASWEERDRDELIARSALPAEWRRWCCLWRRCLQQGQQQRRWDKQPPGSIYQF